MAGEQTAPDMSHVPVTSYQHGRGHAFDALPNQAEYYDDHHEGVQRSSVYNGREYQHRESMKLKPQNMSYIHTRSVSSESERGEYYQQYRPNSTAYVKQAQQPSPYPQQEQSQPIPDRKRPNYKPSALRWPFLTILLLTLLALVGLMVYAQRALPTQHYDQPLIPTDLSRVIRRQGGATLSSSSVVGESSSTSTSTSTSSGDDSAKTSVKPSSVHGSIGDQSFTSSSPGTIVATRPSSSHGNIGDQTVTPTRASSSHGDVGPQTITSPVVPTYVTPVATILTNSLGIPTATSISIPSPISTPKTTVMTNSLGQPTATAVTTILVTPSTEVLKDTNGVPTATKTSYPVIPTGSSNNVEVYHLSLGSYFIGLFLPTLAAILISIPIRILDLNAKIFQPWHELTHPSGAAGRESLCLETSGWQSVVTSIRSLFGGQALVFLTTVLTLSSALLIPLSSEAITFQLKGACHVGGGSGTNCAWILSVFDKPAKATLGVLAFMAVTMLFIIAFLFKWKSGVSTNPWSIAGVASLSTNREVRGLFVNLSAGADAGGVPQKMLNEALSDRRFALGYFYGPNGTVEYGIKLVEEYPEGHPLHVPATAAGVAGYAKRSEMGHTRVKKQHHLPFMMLGWIGRSAFLFVLCGLLALILYYNNTGGDNAFEDFMASETFGVRFLFTGVGVIITFFWSAFYDGIAVASPYQLLSTAPQYARRSILLSPPTNQFSGLISAIRRRHPFLAVVAFISILSEFLPIFLANVPYRVVKTWTVHLVTTWSSVGILAIMVIVVVYSFFVKWPHMPVDPSTIAGAMYYVCDSWMLESFEGVSMMPRKERDWKVSGIGVKYEYGEMGGVSGLRRIGVDITEGRTV